MQILDLELVASAEEGVPRIHEDDYFDFSSESCQPTGGHLPLLWSIVLLLLTGEKRFLH